MKKYLTNYFKKKKPFTIVTDVLFLILVILLIIPSTRKDVSAFFIRLTSFPPSALDAGEQYSVAENTLHWELYDLQGGKIELGDILDKPVVLNLWATWCPPCIAELPGLMDLRNEYGEKANFVFVSDENPVKVKDFLKKRGYTQEGFFISKGVPSDFATQSIPTTYIISPGRKVVLKKKGAARWNSGKVKRLIDNITN